jgi:hypothetical protein
VTVQVSVATTGRQIQALTTTQGVGEIQIRVNRGALSRDELEVRFSTLARQWRDQTKYSSSGAELVTHPAYRQIIDLGWAVVPLLLREMGAGPNHWGFALAQITGAQPFDEQDAGRLDRIAAAWVGWGQQHGYMTWRSTA